MRKKRFNTSKIWGPEEVARLEEMRDGGMSDKAIARLVKCSPQNIAQIFRRAEQMRLHSQRYVSEKQAKARIYAMTEALLVMSGKLQDAQDFIVTLLPEEKKVSACSENSPT